MMNDPSSTSSSSGSLPFRESFKDIIVILNDGNQMLMQKCVRCCCVLRNHSFSKMSHWKNCASECCFRYISEIEGAVVAVCLLCQLKIHEPSQVQLWTHHRKCSSESTFQNLDISRINVEERSHEIQYIVESAVTQRELNAQRRLNHGISAPGFLIKLVPTSKGLERSSECQVCKKSKARPSQTYFAAHRRHCHLPGEVLVTVTTQPFDMTISSSIDDSQCRSGLMRACFICNTTASESFVSLYETVSLHSNTPIYDFVWKFLDNKPSIRDDSIDAANSNWSSLCEKCLNKINEYDLACVTASNIEEELRWELSQTEDIYANQQSAMIPEEDEHAIEVHQAPAYIGVSEETINLDSPPAPPDVNSTTATNEVDPIDNEPSIELSDDETVHTIELSDDES